MRLLVWFVAILAGAGLVLFAALDPEMRLLICLSLVIVFWKPLCKWSSGFATPWLG